ncbi:MAG: hypothetical protein KAR54_02025 [Candidatus Pacebacteria bacterium]|nr:hypothetical protein [Candidatus Paceibacterota bacterium]
MTNFVTDYEKEIMESSSLEDLLLVVKRANTLCKMFSEECILKIFDLCDAYWMHNGNPKKPHAMLTSGYCSNGFFNCLEVLKYSQFSNFLAQQLALLIRKEFGNISIDWVIGSPMAGITFAHDVCRALGAKISFFTEKDYTRSKKMLWNRTVIPEGETVLQIEELITTAQTLDNVQEAIIEGNPHPINFLPFIGVLVHRPAKLPVPEYNGRKVISAIEKEIWATNPEDCALCKQGSTPYRPKQNWSKLTSKQ